MIQYQFKNVKVRCMCIQCTNCKKQVPCKLSETVMIDNLPLSIEDIMFHHVGLLWTIETD